MASQSKTVRYRTIQTLKILGLREHIQREAHVADVPVESRMGHKLGPSAWDHSTTRLIAEQPAT
jgi:hypothetical protein